MAWASSSNPHSDRSTVPAMSKHRRNSKSEAVAVTSVGEWLAILVRNRASGPCGKKKTSADWFIASPLESAGLRTGSVGRKDIRATDGNVVR